MQPPCPNCDTPLASSTVGFLCTNCGRAYRYAEPDPEIDPLATTSHGHHQGRSSNSGDAAYSWNPDTTNDLPAAPIPPVESEQLSSRPESSHHTEPDFSSAQIINPHRSSHARRRLEHANLTIDERETSAPSFEAHHTNPNNLDHELPPVTQPSPTGDQETHVVTEPPLDSSWHDHESLPQAHSLETDESATPFSLPEESNTEEEEAKYGPYKPSRHILNVAEAEEAGKQPYTPHSPLDVSHKDPDRYIEQATTLDETPELLPSFVDTQAAPTPIGHSSQPMDPLLAPQTAKNPPVQSAEALAKADALLAAASTPAPNTRSRNSLFLAVGAVAILAIGSLVALLILRPAPATSPSPSTSPVVSSVAPTNTQSPASKRDKQRKDDLNSLSVALAAYQKATGAYPVGTDITALVPLTTATPAYLKEINLDPLSDQSSGVLVKYGYSSDGKTYTLTANLENNNDPDGKNGLYVVKSPGTN